MKHKPDKSRTGRRKEPGTPSSTRVFRQRIPEQRSLNGQAYRQGPSVPHVNDFPSSSDQPTRRFAED
jgi:hypothetical protein